MMDMKMVDMELDADEAKEQLSTESVDAPKYSYGLKLSLNNDSIDKLGIPALPAVGQKMMVHAMVEVCCISEYDSKEGGKNRSMELQITEMALMSPDSMKNPAKELYA